MRAKARRTRPRVIQTLARSKCGRRRRKCAAVRFCGVRFGWIQPEGLSCVPMKRASLVLLIGCLSASALATTYVRVEKDGSKTYSDRPLPGGQPVDIQPAQTYSAPSTPSVDSTRSREEQDVLAAANFQYTCALTPRNDETFQNPESVMLAVQL